MDIYVTKKVDSGDDFSLAPLNTLPHVHLVITSVLIKRDMMGNYYLSDFQEPNIVNNLIKLKKIILKKQDSKTKSLDDIIWVKPSPKMIYKKNNVCINCPKLVIDFPVQLQISCNTEDVYFIDKPHCAYNICWTVDYIIVDEKFDLSILG